jgi:hypothetical protein
LTQIPDYHNILNFKILIVLKKIKTTNKNKKNNKNKLFRKEKYKKNILMININLFYFYKL